MKGLIVALLAFNSIIFSLGLSIAYGQSSTDFPDFGGVVGNNSISRSSSSSSNILSSIRSSSSSRISVSSRASSSRLSSSSRNSNFGNSQNNNQVNNTRRICIARNGRLTVRTRCRSNETELNSSVQTNLTDNSSNVLSAGQIIYGVIGSASYSNSNGSLKSSSSLNAILRNNLNDADVIVARSSALEASCDGAINCLASQESANAASCIGSASAPTSPAGKLCIYPTSVFNATNINAVALPENGGSIGISLNWTAIQSATSELQAVWVYTAP